MYRMTKRSQCTRCHPNRGLKAQRECSYQSPMGKNDNKNGLCVCVVGRTINVKSFFVAKDRAEIMPDSQWTYYSRVQERLVMNLALVVVPGVGM